MATFRYFVDTSLEFLKKNKQLYCRYLKIAHLENELTVPLIVTAHISSQKSKTIEKLQIESQAEYDTLLVPDSLTVASKTKINCSEAGGESIDKLLKMIRSMLGE